MKVLLIFVYFVTVADAYYSTLFVEPKNPPKFQISQVSLQSSETGTTLR